MDRRVGVELSDWVVVDLEFEYWLKYGIGIKIR